MAQARGLGIQTAQLPRPHVVDVGLARLDCASISMGASAPSIRPAPSGRQTGKSSCRRPAKVVVVHHEQDASSAACALEQMVQAARTVQPGRGLVSSPSSRHCEGGTTAVASFIGWGRKAVVVEADLFLPTAMFPKSQMCDPRVRFCERPPSATRGAYSSTYFVGWLVGQDLHRDAATARPNLRGVVRVRGRAR